VIDGIIQSGVSRARGGPQRLIKMSALVYTTTRRRIGGGNVIVSTVPFL
jgi:hypothetical protein